MGERKFRSTRLERNSPEAVLYEALIELEDGLSERLEKQERLLQQIESHLVRLEGQIAVIPRHPR